MGVADPQRSISNAAIGLRESSWASVPSKFRKQDGNVQQLDREKTDMAMKKAVKPTKKSAKPNAKRIKAEKRASLKFIKFNG
jgi:hypothetical protein